MAESSSERREEGKGEGEVRRKGKENEEMRNDEWEVKEKGDVVMMEEDEEKEDKSWKTPKAKR